MEKKRKQNIAGIPSASGCPFLSSPLLSNDDDDDEANELNSSSSSSSSLFNAY